ncbi:MAG TPA: PadR family transcriptional regulator [Haloplasmataceae bacterium]
MNIQFKKGVLELCVLALLNQKDCYGYELVNEISKSIVISEGTIYPLLNRLRKDGYVSTYLKESPEGPPRKYYRLTEYGGRVFERLKEEWYTFCEGVNRLLRGSERVEQEPIPSNA